MILRRLKLRSGAMHHYCTLLKRSVEDDGGGGRKPHYVPVLSFWAEIKPVQSWLSATSAANHVAVTHFITTRFEDFPDIKGEYQIQHIDERRSLTRTFSISGVVNKGDDRGGERMHVLVFNALELEGVN